MNQEDTLAFTRDCILKIEERFRDNPSIYFNESDIQADLFSMLLAKFRRPIRIKKILLYGTIKQKPLKPIFTRRLHSELLLPEGRIDLAILDLNNIKFAMNSRGKYGHIQLEKGEHVFIEIKSSRTNRSSISSKHEWKKLILKDIEKLNKYTCQGFLLCFDYRDILEEKDVLFLRKKVTKNVEFIYCISPIKDNFLNE